MSAALAAAPAAPHLTAAAGRGGYRVAVSSDWPAASAAWFAAQGTDPAPNVPFLGTPFQSRRWLDGWYEAHRTRADIEPLVVEVERGGRPALLLPLVRRREGRVRVAEFADLGLTDYNLPLLGPAAPGDPAGAALLWRALRRALPADLVRLKKMPARIGGAPNPLALLPRSAPCALGGNLVTVGEDYTAYLRGTLARPVRMELERNWRVFARHPGAAFRQVTDPAEAVAMLDVMDRQQRARMEAIGRPYTLDQPEAAALYRSLVRRHLVDGYAVLTALTAGEELVAAMLGVRDAGGLVVIRLSNAGGPTWSRCSPGRLVLERTLAHLHDGGCRRFDFSIGDYDYKRRFGAVGTPLLDITAAPTPLGWPGLARAEAAAYLRRRPALDARVRRWLRRPGSSGEG